jgi:transmembrane sensor
MFNDRLAQLMARRITGEASPEELKELDVLLKENPQAQYFYQVFSDYWEVHPRPSDNSIQEEIHFQQILAIAEKDSIHQPNGREEWVEERPAKIILLKRVLAAAVVITVVIGSYFFIASAPSQSSKNRLAINEVSAKPGTKTYLLLPDGTKVWLNSESKLEYQSNFNDSIREVTLEGEAFFDVVRDKTRPFIVHTSDIDIRVLGTAFNVKSYPKESSIEATLIHGMIEITNKKEPSSPKVILRPHEKLVFNKQSAIPKNVVAKEQPVTAHKPFAITALPKNVADSALTETSWVYNKLLFDGETLRENVAKLERWYNVKIKFKGDRVGHMPIRYPLSDETLEEALKALQYIEPFQYKINGNEIEISKK